MVNAALFRLRSLLAVLVVAAAGVPVAAFESEQCERDAFGSYIQKDYKDTRARILETRALDKVETRTADSGRIYVKRGSWHDKFTGRVLVDVPAEAVEIDHIIPLCWAWDHGAAAWSYEKRREFYNDERYLLVVASHLNASKGDAGPDVFMPLNRAFRCEYVLLFLDGVARYGLTLSPTEIVALHGSRAAACGEIDTLFN